MTEINAPGCEYKSEGYLKEEKQAVKPVVLRRKYISFRGDEILDSVTCCRRLRHLTRIVSRGVDLRFSFFAICDNTQHLCCYVSFEGTCHSVHFERENLAITKCLHRVEGSQNLLVEYVAKVFGLFSVVRVE